MDEAPATWFVSQNAANAPENLSIFPQVEMGIVFSRSFGYADTVNSKVTMEKKGTKNSTEIGYTAVSTFRFSSTINRVLNRAFLLFSSTVCSSVSVCQAHQEGTEIFRKKKKYVKRRKNEKGFGKTTAREGNWLELPTQSCTEC